MVTPYFSEGLAYIVVAEEVGGIVVFGNLKVISFQRDRS